MGALLCVCEAERVPASVPTGEGQCDKREECDKRRTRGVGRGWYGVRYDLRLLVSVSVRAFKGYWRLNAIGS
jgi:hypothetical protein